MLSSDVANAASYILQGVFTWGGATAAGLGPLPSGYPIAGKTGTSNVASGNGTPYAAFAGYTSALVSYTSVFNPISPTVHDTMSGATACYREWYGGQNCPGEMLGADAPGCSTWRGSLRARPTSAGREAFGTVSPSSKLWSKGNGQVVPVPPKAPKKPGKGGGGAALQAAAAGWWRRWRRRRWRRWRWRNRWRERPAQPIADLGPRARRTSRMFRRSLALSGSREPAG